MVRKLTVDVPLGVERVKVARVHPAASQILRQTDDTWEPFAPWLLTGLHKLRNAGGFRAFVREELSTR